MASGKEVILVELRQEVGTATAGEAVRWKRAGLRRALNDALQLTNQYTITNFFRAMNYTEGQEEHSSMNGSVKGA